MKKLSHTSNQGKREFENEAKLLARVQHRNVVNLYGYCTRGNEKLLVYEYVMHESLDKLLFSEYHLVPFQFIFSISIALSYLFDARKFESAFLNNQADSSPDHQ